MLKKQYVKSRNVCKVTFEIPKTEMPEEVSPEVVSLLGDFNGWDADATPMQKVKSTGSFKAVVDLEPEATYQFRYLINNSYWYNEPAASAYAPNGFGTENAVLETKV